MTSYVEEMKELTGENYILGVNDCDEIIYHAIGEVGRELTLLRALLRVIKNSSVEKKENLPVEFFKTIEDVSHLANKSIESLHELLQKIPDES